MATPDIVKGPPGPPAGEAVADVIPLIPRQDDGEFFAQVQEGAEDLGYTLMPSQAPDLSIGHVVSFPIKMAGGLGRAAFDITRHYSGGALDRFVDEPEQRIMPAGDQERVVLITESEGGGKAAMTDILVFGLSELETGSGLLMHKAMSARHPERRTISLTTPGVTMAGRTLSIAEGLSRPLGTTAAENNRLIAELAGDGKTNVTGTSLGSFITMLMVKQNLDLGDRPMVNMAGVKLVSPAVGALNVPEAELFSEADAGDKEFIAHLTDEFFRHMPKDAGRMLLRYPDKAAECVSALLAYVLEPHKLPHRLAAMTGNVRGVQEGIEWEDIKAVAQAHPLHVVGGERDPLMQAQLPQLVAVRRAAPATSIRVLEGLGHAMTINSPETVEHLAQMEAGEPPLAIAA